MPGTIYSLFYASLLNYDADDDSEMAKKGWLDLNKYGTDTMQDVFKTKYAFYTIIVFSCQFCMLCILLAYNFNQLDTNLMTCVSEWLDT